MILSYLFEQAQLILNIEQVGHYLTTRSSTTKTVSIFPPKTDNGGQTAV